MSAKWLAWTTGICSGVLAIACIIGTSETAPLAEGDAKQEAKELFGAAKPWTVDLDLSAAEYQAMQPAAPAFPGGPPQPRKDKRPTVSNRFGTAFPWVE